MENQKSDLSKIPDSQVPIVGLTKLINQTLDLDILLKKIVFFLKDKFNTGKVFLIASEGGEEEGYLVNGECGEDDILIKNTPIEDVKDKICIPIINSVIKAKKYFLAKDHLYGDFSSEEHLKNSRPKSILCVPLIIDKPFGVIYFENDEANFQDNTCQMLELLGKPIAYAIKNAYTFKTLKLEAIKAQSELKAKEQELIEASKTLSKTRLQMLEQERMAAIGIQTAGIIHEIKNPLNFVINFSQVSQDVLSEIVAILQTQELDYKLNQKDELLSSVNFLKDSLLKIDSHGTRALKIIKTMLAHSRTDNQTVVEKTNIHELLQQAFGLSYSSFRNSYPDFSVSVVYNLDKETPLISAYPSLQRAFLNIIDNSCYAMRVKKAKLIDNYTPTLTISTKNLVDKIEIIIEDNGTGISKEDMKKLFHPFFTTKTAESGTGLGLSIISDIIKNEHGGEILLISELDHFTRVIIELPKSKENSS